LAEIIVKESLAKVKDKRTKTPFQRKYKKTYNATWEVKHSVFNLIYREEKKMISLLWSLLL
jgi:hypothetical protein